ncbi:MAG: N-acetyltransferase [Cytophagaceae bacterium]|nr:N-acetyltransferase [Cytophagaceae bacterium]MBP6093240.1 N-acetyltransferase [Cytophagaceae bacterium]
MAKIHPLSDVQSNTIGQETSIWQFVVILPHAVIGENCNICAHTFIENDVIIGDEVTIKSGVYLWDGIRVEDRVFIGPNVTFTNDKYPRSKSYPNQFQNTLIKKGASIGAGSIILGGVEIGQNAMIGAGSLVTQDVPPNELWYGSPAKFVRKINSNND